MRYSSKLLSYLSRQAITYAIYRELLISKVFEIEHGDMVRDIPKEVVIWYVKSCEKHPDADKLFVCQVNCGQKGDHQDNNLMRKYLIWYVCTSSTTRLLFTCDRVGDIY